MHDLITNARKKRGFLSVDDVVNKIGTTNTILDMSVLIGENVKIGSGNVFFSNVVLECTNQGTVTIGNNNVFYPGTYIFSSDGSITIGNDNEFGTNGCNIKANMPDAAIVIGNGGRYTDGASIMGKSNLGSGSQVLGHITVQGCHLEAGGTYQTSDPDERASVLKGFGLARGIVLEKGQVVNGMGNFSDAPVEWQRAYHPKSKVQPGK